MRVLILRSREGWHIDRLEEALLAAGADVLKGSIDGMILRLGAGRGLDMEEVAVRGVDAVIVRIIPPGSMEGLLFRMNALRMARTLGVKVINSPEAIEKTVDKSWTSQILDTAGLPTPRTVVCERFDDAMAAFERMRDVVVKPLIGSCGRGLMRICETDMAYRVFRTMEMNRYVYYIQEYLECGGEDIRLFVAGGHVVAAMKRRGAGWKANFHAGGAVSVHEPTDIQADMAIRACAELGLDYGGVDILTTGDGQEYLIEVNGIPGWKGLQKTTSVDIAERIVSAALYGQKIET
ncbi:MAG: RimK family alpha-L-glutamate ligase [Nitrospinota bacterium]|nr:RimK family alpha-L-glutamate ligase [Nitrospinota bacterium]